MPNKFSSRPRQWGTRFDYLPSSSPPPSPSKSEASVVQDRVVTATRNEDRVDASPSIKGGEKMPHDASVFVGSLPPNMDSDELSRLLTEHLAEHAQVQCVKVIRDRQGGACAFVQCQDAASAARLVHTLRSTPPKPFLGRTLRYEPARAFRTLLISYRTPTQDMPTEQNDADINIPGQRVELELPFAMRIWKAKNHQQLSIIYNHAAIDAERRRRQNHESPTEPVLQLENLAFDEETLKVICAYFGALDTFEALKPAGPIIEDGGDSLKPYASYPSPHDAPRRPTMDQRCFEVKWEHRDDCVSALMTLRRVPHLTVTWAHNTTPSNTIDHKRRFSQPNSLHRRTFSVNRERMVSQPTATAVHPFDSEDNTWAVSVARAHGSPYASQDSTLVDNPQVEGHSLVWSETDFPPLTDPKGIRIPSGHGLWHQSRVPFNKELMQCHSSVGAVTAMLGNLEISNVDLTPRPNATPSASGGDVELNLPETPGLMMSPTTPKSPTSTFLRTPSSNGEAYKALPMTKDIEDDDQKHYEGTHQDEKVLDPTTLFVGGLEMHGPGAWDEMKVQKYFQKFDGLESVKIIRPANGKAAFAFVKFDNTESPARAIDQEHNRVYEGRAMRVQLRECNLTRGTWRGRGRGRFVNHGYNNRPQIDPLEFGIDVSHDPERTLTDMSVSTNNAEEEVNTIETSPIQPEKASPSTMAEVATPHVERQEMPIQSQGMNLPNASNTAPPAAAVDASAQVQQYREWYEIETPSQEPPFSEPTPPPATPVSAPDSTASASYSVAPTPGYFAPPSWFPAYVPQYPVPYVPGFPLYHPVPNPPPPAPYPPGSNASDGSSSAPVTPNHWQPVGMYGTYVPYPFPPPPRPPQVSTEQPPQTQPPVAPTGFYHSDHGTLFAVYRPEAIDQYNQIHGNSTQPVAVSAPVSRVWPQYPPPPPGYPVPNAGQNPARVSGAPVPGSFVQVPKPVQNMGGWIQPPSIGGARIQGGISSLNGSGSFRGHQSEGGGNYGKRGRRDSGYPHNGNRNGPSRQGPHRNGRGGGIRANSDGDALQVQRAGEFSTNAAHLHVGGYSNGWPAVTYGQHDGNKPYLT
ncbi:rna-binding protein [Moniliophthora roreri MCA 2997]|uniref:Rna-binding protein n=1 Tax=Moniliophthora roreri (strain MCA 2997) TaxID=1381753 RepID=V2XYX8_MONRO|nr:rna-binding protein [Moniliophthora roreri MCA 2997]